MATISSAGVGSGLDVNTLVSKLMAAESAPLNSLDTRVKSYNSKISALGLVKSSLGKLQSAINQLSLPSTFQSYSANFANTDFGSGTANSFAAPGNYEVRVNSLANAGKWKISGIGGSLAAGNLEIVLGGASKGTVNFAGGSAADLRAAINSANLGVTATVSGGQLLLTSNETGASNDISFGPATSGSLSGLTFEEVQNGTDANVDIDGITVTSSTNVVSDALTGVTLTLKKAHPPATPPYTPGTDTTTLTVGPDKDAMVNRIQSFVTAWNDLSTTIRNQTKYDPSTKVGAALNGDTAVSSIYNTLRNDLFSNPSGVSTTYKRLSDLGVTLQADGNLALDSTKLREALSNNLADATATITAFGSQLKNTADAMTQSGGVLSTRQDGLNSTVKSLGDRREQLVLQLTAVEKRYRAQFTALDVAMGKLQSQSSYLAQQLARLA